MTRFLVLLLLVQQATTQHATAQYAQHPLGPRPDSTYLVPSNQLISPAGRQIYLPGGRPVGLALTNDKKYLLVKNIRTLDLIRLSDNNVQQSLPIKGGASFNGMAISGTTIYLTRSDDKLVKAALIDDSLVLQSLITLPHPSIGGDPAPGGVAIISNTLLVTLSRNNTLAVIEEGDSTRQIPVGIAPFGVLALDETKAYVTNWGGRRPLPGEYTENTSGSAILVDKSNGVASDGSVSVVDLKNRQTVRDIHVGLHPSAMALSPDRQILYVACANSDRVYVIDTKTDVITDSIKVTKDTLLGSAPNALATDGNRLFVANGTQNAIAVIDARPPYALQGYIPTGWYPGAVVTDGKTLYVANIKGIGSRTRQAKGYTTHGFMGSVSVIGLPANTASANWLKPLTASVNRNNGIAESPQSAPRFKHVVYIIKENRVYDQLLGDLPQGNGDTALVLFGRRVTPNHHKLAEDFVLLDNYYTSGVLSADGHQWTDEAYATDYLEKSFGGFSRSYPYDGDDALAYAASGFLWDNVLRHGLTFRDYGEFVAGIIKPQGAHFIDIFNNPKSFSITAKANIGSVKPYMCPDYIGFPNEVPDQYRADVFLKEFKRFQANDSFPSFTIMLLPCDHTSGTAPGMPTTQASVADNDLALGRIVDAISHSKYWKETCIFVTEDDSQDGADHVDGHRTVGFVISPYTKRGQVVSTYYSQVSMVRTIENVLGLPPMNQLDRASGDMSACFTAMPDFTPYDAVPNNIPLDSLNPPLKMLTGKQLSWARQSVKQDLSNYDRVDEKIFNEIIWHSVKGYEAPYPISR